MSCLHKSPNPAPTVQNLVGTLRLYGNEEIKVYPAGSWDMLPKTTEIDRDQVTYACALMGWNPFDFTICTLAIDFPLMYSVIVAEIAWN